MVPGSVEVANKSSRRPLLYTLAVVLVSLIGVGLLVSSRSDMILSRTSRASPSKFETVVTDLQESSQKVKPVDGGKEEFAPGKETYSPTPENLGKKGGKRALKHTNGKNFEETFNPTPEDKKRELKHTNGKNFEETFNPTPEDKKRGLKHTNGKNFEETFNPTPEDKKRRTLKNVFAPGKETYNPTPEDKGKPSKKRALKHSSKVDTINFDETFNPTPVKLHPTKRPVNDRRTLKNVKPEDGGENEFAPGKETYNPTPENLGKKSGKRELKHTNGKNFEETFNPTPESLRDHARLLKKTSLSQQEASVLTTEEKASRASRLMKELKKIIA